MRTTCTARASRAPSMDMERLVLKNIHAVRATIQEHKLPSSSHNNHLQPPHSISTAIKAPKGGGGRVGGGGGEAIDREGGGRGGDHTIPLSHCQIVA